MSRVLPVLVLCALTLLPAGALASPGSGQPAVVSMGDSYISGEAGRWTNNSLSPTPGNDGTDRACLPAGSPTCSVDKSKVYVDGTDKDGCHRSDVAEVLSAKFAGGAQGVNIACSGAVAKNLYRSSNGGVGQNGEPAQGDLLAGVAKAKNVKLIVVSVGGNDLGFASIIGACLAAYTSRTGPCKPAQQPIVEGKIATATAAVVKSIDEIRAVMSAAGYKAGDYRLVYQTYPVVVTRAADTRYGENDPQRSAAGCPLYDTDLDWARGQLGPEVGNMVLDAARARGVETLQLIDLLNGHELCAKTDANATPTSRPGPATSEWGRLLGATTVQQGDLQEAFHPNALAQAALGVCLTGVFASAPGGFTCSNSAGRLPTQSVLRPNPGSISGGSGNGAVGSAARPALRLSARRVGARRAGQVCYAFTTTSGGRRVRSTRVSFAGKSARIGSSGRVTLCTATRPSTQVARATRAGYRSARRTVHVPRAGTPAARFTG
jgi:hypothetical protein